MGGRLALLYVGIGIDGGGGGGRRVRRRQPERAASVGPRSLLDGRCRAGAAGLAVPFGRTGRDLPVVACNGRPMPRAFSFVCALCRTVEREKRMAGRSRSRGRGRLLVGSL